MDWDDDGDMDLIVGDVWGYVTLFSNVGSRNEPVLTRSGRLTANGQEIDAGYFAVPVIIDWNNDHKKDLVLGTESEGIRIYLNSGTDNAPVFTDYSSVDSAYFFRGHPEVLDLNEDGRKDLLVGADGYIYYFKNQGSDARPEFNHGERLLLKNNSEIHVFDRARVDAADWNQDGKIDLIVGDNEGYISIFLNKGVPAGLKDRPVLPTNVKLFQNYPNPFGVAGNKMALGGYGSTTIAFKLQKPEQVSLTIYSSDGREIRQLLNRQLNSGSHSVQWSGNDQNGRAVASGVYYYELRSNTFRESRKMLLFR